MSNRKAALWMRVSTADQHTENQRQQLLEYCDRADLDVVSTFDVEGSAWQGAQKPALDELIKVAHRKEVDVVVIWALDRLDRSSPAGCWIALNKLQETGVEVVSLQEPWVSTQGPFAELLALISSWFAWWYSERQSERIKAGIDRRRKAGKSVGRKTGAKDKTPRIRAGYVKRWEDEKNQKTGD